MSGILSRIKNCNFSLNTFGRDELGLDRYP
ncbi:Unannotated [Lentimonas sp. CC4]|nr:Unannotated [Lentimonas sp. CC4]CAA6685719.1 Unannotated [Lentimonas sp. CC6]CAA7077162.1 Unannotated [Lentimonas sp. CC4]CAA7168754.1 Unannotated [Lentimonas sp. CC21]CAA7180878.1 Unannotated [Lentimonas sp. CC8]